MKSYSLLLAIGCLGGFAAFAQQATNGSAASNAIKASESAMDEKQAATNPRYSLAVLGGKDPHEHMSEFEARICQGPSPRPCPGALAYASKAALEAGEDKKAHDYAVEALQSADSIASRYEKLGRKAPRSYAAVPVADFYGNFVLGRLAILDGDIRSAERYLLDSGRTLGDPDLKCFGPNMSLALELLKHGDTQSRQTVLQFLDEIKVFWTLDPDKPPLDKWSAQIAAGETPVFRIGDLALSNLFN